MITQEIHIGGTLPRLLCAQTLIGQAWGPAGIFDAAVALYGMAPDADLILAALHRYAATKGDHELEMLCSEFDALLGDE